MLSSNIKFINTRTRAYLPGVRVNRDHEGGSLRRRPYHCTPVWLNSASVPNADTSDA